MEDWTTWRSTGLQVASTTDKSLPQHDREQFLKASTAILHIGSTPVKIQSRHYYDGGYQRNVPIEPLLERDLDEIWVVPLTPIRHRGQPRASRTVHWAKRSLPHPLTHSLFSFAEQTVNPPTRVRGPARKVILSPHLNQRHDQVGLLKSPMFSPDNVRTLVDMGFADGLATVQEYQTETSSVFAL